jgi:hypothetical protein
MAHRGGKMYKRDQEFIKRQLEWLVEPLWLLAKRDKRMGAKIFYKNSAFMSAVTAYFSAADKLNRDWTDWTEKNLKVLERSLSDFLAIVETLFHDARPRVLTTMRARVGAGFVKIYKNSRTLREVLNRVVLEEVALERIEIPEQQSSPIYTKVESDRIVLDAGRALHPFLRREAVTETRRYLRRELSELNESLGNSNVDPRFLAAFNKLKGFIDFEDDAGAISFGLHVRSVARLAIKLEDELSDVLNVQIASTLTHASYFASQYKDWVEFLHNAQQYPARANIENEIDKALDDVTATLTENPETVDERIPHSIQLISGLLKGSTEDRTNAIYAGVRGVENICIVSIKFAYNEALRLLQDAGIKARPALVRIGAAVIVGLALTVISNFLPVIKNASELNWILENLPRIENLQRILK